MISHLILSLASTFFTLADGNYYITKNLTLTPGIHNIQTEAPWNAVTLLNKGENSLPDLQYKLTINEPFKNWEKVSPHETQKEESFHTEEDHSDSTKLLTLDNLHQNLFVKVDTPINLTAHFYNTQSPLENLFAQAGLQDINFDFNRFRFSQELLEGVEVENFYNGVHLGSFALEDLKPQYITRAGWDAKEELRVWNANRGISRLFRLFPPEVKWLPKSLWPTVETRTNEKGEKLTWPIEKSKEIKKIVIHHTAEYIDDDKKTRRSPKELMRGIAYYHTISKGWGDIGYNYVIGKEGDIYEGRAGGIGTVGAHVAYHNVGTIGISLMGNFELQEPSDAQMKVLAVFLAYLSDKYNIDPIGHSEHLNIRSYNIDVHKNVTQPGHGTACAGTNLVKRMPQLREDINNILEMLHKHRDELIPSGLDFLKKSNIAPDTQPYIRFERPEKEPIISLGKILKTKLIQRDQNLSIDITLQNNSKKTWPKGSKTVIKFPPQGLTATYFEAIEDIRSGENGIFRGKIYAHTIPNGHYELELDPIFLKDSFFKGISRPTFTVPIQVSGNGNIKEFTDRLKRNHYQRKFKQESYLSSIKPLSASTFRNARQKTLPTQKNIKVKLAFFDASYAKIKSPSIIKILEGEELIAEIPANEIIKVTQINNKSLQIEGLEKKWTAGKISFQSQSPLEITNYDRNLSPKIKYNRFRHQINIHPQPEKKLLVVNEIPIEDYLYGLAEEPGEEFRFPAKVDAINILARSYAYVYSGERRKFRTHLYDLEDDPRSSQFYLGYDWEVYHPEQIKRTDLTRGIVLTHQNNPVIGPYFTQSSGESSCKWFSQYPWARCRELPFDKGLEARGHGVGLSGHSARALAQEGKSYKEIIDYFFREVQLKKVY